uniref:Uncharacterized protein n=1 Tax=Fibrocapsa japonica TaxID=94617 RepID=A0A7S2V651_9STRA
MSVIFGDSYVQLSCTVEKNTDGSCALYSVKLDMDKILHHRSSELGLECSNKDFSGYFARSLQDSSLCIVLPENTATGKADPDGGGGQGAEAALHMRYMEVELEGQLPLPLLQDNLHPHLLFLLRTSLTAKPDTSATSLGAEQAALQTLSPAGPGAGAKGGSTKGSTPASASASGAGKKRPSSLWNPNATAKRGRGRQKAKGAQLKINL